MPRVGVIILAAGESKRLGKPKQAIPFRGKTLLRHAAEIALASKATSVVVVLGAYVTDDLPAEVIVVENNRWMEGLATSIHAGLAKIESQVDAALLMLCDQPLITAEILNEFIAKADRALVAAEYNGTIGVPALFAKEYFDELRELRGEKGAKQILLNHEAQVERIQRPEGAVDIDTASDVERLHFFE